MVEAADVVALDRAGGELRPAMRAPVADEVRGAALAPVDREVLAHDPDRLRVARLQQRTHVDGLPELPEIASGERSRAGVNEVDCVRHAVRLRCGGARLDAAQRERPVILEVHVVHSGFAPESRTILPHLAISLLRNAASASGVLDVDSMPSLARVWRTVAELNRSTVSRFSFATISFGVSPELKTANQRTTS